MATDRTPPQAAAEQTKPDRAESKALTPAAERALAEAAARRAEHERRAADRPKELHGRGGLEPTRYGDWEINGLISDF
jgi:hypothetical protein